MGRPPPMKRLGLFFRRQRRERALLLEALLALCYARLVIKLVPFRRLAPRLGRSETETVAAVTPAERALAVEISWAVQAVARHAPVDFVCLPQALAARRMLRARGLASTLYFGAARDVAQPGAVTSHAWLRVGDKIVTGEREAPWYVVVAKFADESG